MKYQIYLILCAVCLLANTTSWAQDPIYSQFYAAPLQLNPALTGVTAAPTIHLNYRNQWSAINNAYSTYSASFSQYVPKLHSGFGVLAMADVAGNGIYNTNNIGLFYAYDARFSENFYIRVGMEGNFVNKRLNWNKLVFLDQISPETGAVDNNGNPNPTAEVQPNLSTNYVDFGAGMVVHTKYVYGGFSIKHLNAPEEGFYRINGVAGELPLRLTIHAGGQINLIKRKHNKAGKSAFISPNVLFVKQRQFHQLNIGAYAQYDMFFGGLFFRHTFGNSDAVIISAGFEKGPFKLGYSYDLTVSRLTYATGGTHELSLTLNFEDKTKRNKQRYNNCLEIFR